MYNRLTDKAGRRVAYMRLKKERNTHIHTYINTHRHSHTYTETAENLRKNVSQKGKKISLNNILRKKNKEINATSAKKFGI